MAVIKDVANLAGLSVSVVSKYLKNPDRVRDDTRRRVERAIRELNYKPSTAARALRTGLSGMISVISPNITNPFFAELFDIIQTNAASRGYTAILQTMNTAGDTGSVVSETFAVSSVSRVDGIIVCFPDDETVIPFLQKQWGDLPVVLLTWKPLDSCVPSCVLMNVEKGIYTTTRHLLSLGHRNIGYVAAPGTSITSKEKYKGFLRALREQRITVLPEHVFHGPYGMDTGYQAARTFLKSDTPPTAIVTENDIFAIGCIKYCHKKKIRVPDDMAVTGFDDIPMAAMYEPPITTLRPSLSEMGEAAVKKLCHLITDDKVTENPVFEAALIVRRSTDHSFVEEP